MSFEDYLYVFCFLFWGNMKNISYKYNYHNLLYKDKNKINKIKDKIKINKIYHILYTYILICKLYI